MQYLSTEGVRIANIVELVVEKNCDSLERDSMNDSRY